MNMKTPNSSVLLILFFVNINLLSAQEVLFTEKEAQVLNLAEVCRQIEYPKEALHAGIEGIVQILVNVDEQGNYLEHKIAHSPHHSLSHALAPYIPCLGFEPAMHQGVQISGWKVVPFRFRISAFPERAQATDSLEFICPTEKPKKMIISRK